MRLGRAEEALEPARKSVAMYRENLGWMTIEDRGAEKLLHDILVALGKPEEAEAEWKKRCRHRGQPEEVILGGRILGKLARTQNCSPFTMSRKTRFGQRFQVACEVA